MRSRLISRMVLAAGLAVTLTAGYYLWRERPAHRVYRVGFESNPPSQILQPGGEPTGFAVEFVREAARRRGIRLQWVYAPNGSEDALTHRRVDLWPLMTITEGRRAEGIHFTTPYLGNDLGFLVRADSPYYLADELRNTRITSSDVPIVSQLLRARYPQITHVPSVSRAEAIRQMCRGEFSAVFGELFSLYSPFLNDLHLCPETAVRMLPVLNLHTRMGVASVPEARAAADTIRDGITDMIHDGSAQRLCARWNYPSGHELASIGAVEVERRRVLWYRTGIVFTGVLFLFGVWAAVGFRRAKNRTEASGRALQKSERRLELAISATADAVWEWNLRTGEMYYSPRWYEILGHAEEQLPMTVDTLWSLCHPEDMQPTRERIQATLAQPESNGFVAEFRMRHRDGSWKWILGRGNVVERDAEGRPLLLSGTNTDITAQRQLEEQFRQAQKMEAIGRLAGGVAHDFNNLLTVINGYSTMTISRMPAADPLREYVEEIRKAGERAAGLTRQLLAFSRKQFLQPRVLDLNGVVEGMRSMLLRLVGEDVKVSLTLSQEHPVVHADANQVEQVLMNLAVNARDAMPGGGKLLIETKRVELEEHDAASPADLEPGCYVVLAVSDTGLGMDEATQQRIFEPFFTTKEAGKGTGLGLSMVQGVVEQSGGHIYVSSEPGRGTTFKIYLPALADAEIAAEAPAAVTPQRGTETVLIVEDEPEVRQFAAKALRSYGYRVLLAANAGNAVAICERADPHIDLVLTDVVMPDMNGRELVNRLIQLRTGIKPLFMSGYTDNVVVQHGVLDGTASFIQKPFNPEELAVKVRAVLGPASP